MSQVLIWLLPAALVLAALGIGAMAWVTGWRRLARAYPWRPRGPGQSLRVPWIYFGMTRYRNLVVAHADAAHLHLALWLRIGHPPISVPWSELRATPETWQLRHRVRLRFARVPEVAVRLSEAGAERLLEACGGRLHVEAPVDEVGKLGSRRPSA